ncbi:hypothetical protein J009_05643 [Cryptococcus neoformans]|nr:hypothetical protein J009_05643 [Cryptococcus neoformans var. grubii]OXH48207.1 hypothetical protein J002_05609 [Cryptococcus neoformans var. grubii]OXH65357.1 hypothetical protein J001_05635 [Cryptococcus neoformans var. grubii]
MMNLQMMKMMQLKIYRLDILRLSQWPTMPDCRVAVNSWMTASS